MPRAPLALTFAFALALVAGCISPDVLQKEAASAERPHPAVPADRVDGMTVDGVQVKDSAVACTNGSLELPTSTCMQREVTASGRIGLDKLPVTLIGDNGAIVLHASEGDAWSFHAIVKVQATTPDDAKKSLDSAWSWSHVQGDKHELRAGPNSTIPLLGPQIVSARYEVALPAWVLATVTARTSNGGITLNGLQTDKIDASTSNGGVTIAGLVQDVSASTSNGGIEADLQPTASGKVSLHTSNGGVHVQVPEGTAHGYDVDASTSNGRVQILLHDGDSDASGKDHATFKSDQFDQRAIQTALSIATSNGGVTVSPSG